MVPVEDAFRSARIHSARHTRASEKAHLRWGETEIVMSRAAEGVTVVPFTQRAEALSGADWVWWWVDHRSAYGMLVQAKRVTISSGRWAFDFGYHSLGASRTQREVLRSSASALGPRPRLRALPRDRRLPGLGTMLRRASPRSMPPMC